MNHLEVTLTAGCPMMCSYCPQSNYISNYKVKNKTDKKNMSLEDYKTILANVDFKVNDIHFTGFTEPITNPEWYEILKHTKDSGYKMSLNTTLFGATSEDIDKMIGLDVVINIHVTDSKQIVPDEIYREFAQKYKRKFKFDTFTDAAVEKIPDDLKDKVFRHQPQSRADNLDMDHHVFKCAVSCTGNRFFSNVVVPNGDVAVCCSDFSLDHILGNLLEEKLIDIHTGEKMKEFRKKMTEGDPEFICNHCFYAKPAGK